MKRWHCVTDQGNALKDANQQEVVVEANTKGEAKALFKATHGEKSVSTRKKKNKSNTRKRLPQGFRVRLVPAQG